MNDQIISVIADYLQVDRVAITEDTHFKNDLSCDSVRFVQLLMCIEDVFGFEFDAAAAYDFERVADVVRYIETYAKRAI